jgi:stage II sporulation protein D
LFRAAVLFALVSHCGWAQEFRVRMVSPAQRLAAASATAGKLGSHQISVDLDTYVEGVLAGEAAVLKERAALQAMAIVARTWALRYRGRHGAEGFDFCNLTHCQVFRRPADSSGRYAGAISQAVSSTRNQVLEYRGQLADVYFSADCGGREESAANVWPDRGEPYLPTQADPYCRASPHADWQRQIGLGALAQVLREELKLPVGDVQKVSVVERDSSGRARTLEVIAQGRFAIDANQFRYSAGRRLGWDILKSNLYSVGREGDVFVFHGHGLGHGVGLCQAGADAMAGLGAGYENILAHYFPGTTLGEIGERARPAAPASSAKSDRDPTASSEHFELSYPESQKPWVSQALGQLENWRRIVAQYADPGKGRIRVETWDTTEEFIRATGEPGWVGGSSDGNSIFLQPLGTLAARRILDATLRHELAHVAVHRARAAGVPAWFEEGLVLWLSGERVEEGALGTRSRRTLGEAIARPQSAAEMRAAYARALSLVRQISAERGQNALWRILEQPSGEDLDRLKREEAKPLAPSVAPR